MSSNAAHHSTPVDLGSLSGGQWIICIAAAAIFVAVVILNFVLRNARRWRALSDIRLHVVPPGFRTLQDLPRVCASLPSLARAPFSPYARVDLWRAADSVSALSILQPVRDAILAESERERGVKVEPPWPSDCGWGSPQSGDYAGIHFKQSVATSIAVLEERAVRRDKRLSLADFWLVLEERDAADPAHAKEWTGGEEGRERVLRTRAFDIRAYMQLLAQEVPGLDARQASEYASFFERSHTPGVEFTEREYSTFVGLLLGVIRCMDRPRS